MQSEINFSNLCFYFHGNVDDSIVWDLVSIGLYSSF